MRRDILFRGKIIAKKKWVFGDFLHLPSGNAILSNEGYAIIEPETVGQFTGLTDRNGKKIFEGDIISATALDTGKEQRAVVCFGNFIDQNNDDEYIGFFIEFDGIKTTITQLSMEECKNRIEVIGNIYDNEELWEND